MKKALLYSVILLVSILCAGGSASANSAAGGEIIYVHIADSTYQFFVKYYRDCSGSAEPDSMPLCMFNPCTNTTLSYKMAKWQGTLPPGSGPIIGPACNTMKTNCDSVGSPVSAYRVWWYSAIATMPSRCNAWRIFSYGPARNNINNFQNPTSAPLYIEATLNNTVSHVNSSPYYSVQPMYAVPQNNNYSYNNGALDADGDSLWTEVIMPRTGVNNCNDTATNMVFTTTSPQYNLITNPFQTNNSFSLNGHTGYIGFNSTVLGKSNIAIRTKEYRNGVLIGSMMREMQMQTLFYNNPTPIFDTIMGPDSAQWANGMLYSCSGKQLILSFDIKSNDSNSRYYIYDNAATSIPALSTTYTNLGTDSVRVTINWTPNINDVGQHSMIFIIADSNCHSSGIILQYARVLDFKIWGPTKANNDTTICPGKPVALTVSGGGNYQWSILSGTSTISNPNISNPIAVPTTTSTYVVTSTINPYCPDINKDTVTVNMLPPSSGAVAITNTFACGITNPGLNYVYKCIGDTIGFCMNSKSFAPAAKLYQTSNLATTLPAATITYDNQGTDSATATFSWVPTNGDGGLHTIAITTTDSACVPENVQREKVQLLYVYVWPETQTIADTFICAGESIELKVSGGAQFSWDILPGGTPNSLSNPNSVKPIATPTVTTTYAVTSNINTNCTSNKDTVTITVPISVSNPGATSITVSPDSNVANNTIVIFTAASSGCTNQHYDWYINGTIISSGTQSTFTTTPADAQAVWCVISCEDSCSNPAYTTSNKITMRVGLSVNDIRISDDINLYPNPNNGKFRIETEETIRSIEICNIYGQVVYDQFIQNRNNNEINISGLATGVYILKANTPNGIKTTRFTIN